jgi:hypothetical protein
VVAVSTPDEPVLRLAAVERWLNKHWDEIPYGKRELYKILQEPLCPSSSDEPACEGKTNQASCVVEGHR